MSDILILGTARENSSRLPNKMLRPFCGTTLFDIYMRKLERIKELGFTSAIALAKSDKNLWDAAQKYNVEIIERSEHSISQKVRNRSEELSFLKDRKEESIVWLNGCMPLFKTERILNIIDFYKRNTCISLHCVTKRNNWFWDMSGNPINNKDPRNTGTQYCDYVLESAHILHIFKRKVMLEKSSYWEFNNMYDPYLYRLDKSVGLLDIDDEVDFKICEALYFENIKGNEAKS